MKRYNVLWAVTDVIEAESGEAALTELRGKLVDAGFDPYEGTPDIVPDDYQLAFEFEE